MLNRTKLRVGCGLLAIVFLILLIGLGVARYIADRQPVTIRDIPIYPGAVQISTADEIADQSTCPALSYRVTESKAASVQDFYRESMKSRGWLGGGDTEYPTPLLFVRKVPGHFQISTLVIDANQMRVSVEVRLCDQE